ncbi:hypothetical protein Y1Q_0003656 [Alligator mississippiensis]|uniref:Uncharacterized protein n=1 Tax=Alligator mississippiensis TaxID=8496 RepID=A0A151MSJ9_ALLMI|nr:hypothetical protein Y1Q_0003656 [Alligator mississippiensis]
MCVGVPSLLHPSFNQTDSAVPRNEAKDFLPTPPHPHFKTSGDLPSSRRHHLSQSGLNLHFLLLCLNFPLSEMGIVNLTHFGSALRSMDEKQNPRVRFGFIEKVPG